MGTNFYLHRDAQPCPTCHHHRQDPEVHIGKSSGGWIFVWRGYRDDSLVGTTLAKPSDWHTFLAGQVRDGASIRDEYGTTYDLGEFLALVIRKRLVRPDGPPTRRNSNCDSSDSTVHIEGDDVSFNEFS